MCYASELNEGSMYSLDLAERLSRYIANRLSGKKPWALGLPCPASVHQGIWAQALAMEDHAERYHDIVPVVAIVSLSISRDLDGVAMLGFDTNELCWPKGKVVALRSFAHFMHGVAGLERSLVDAQEMCRPQ